MANPHRGETSVEIGGRTYVLVFGTNACAELETLLGRSITSVIDEIKTWKEHPERARVEVMRALIWASLRRNHKSVTVEQAGDLIDEAALEGKQIPIMEAISNAWPSDEEGGETKGERPTNGTGSISKETSSPSDTAAIFSGRSHPSS